MDLGTIIVALIGIVAVIYFIHHVRGLFNGSASCCGGGGNSSSDGGGFSSKLKSLFSKQ